jgi:hypothetical protein
MYTWVARTGSALLLVVLAQGQTATQEDYHGVLRNMPASIQEGLAGRTISSATPFTALSTVVMTPVLYCGAAGGARNEYFVPSAPASAVWLLEVPSPPAGARLFDVRYELLDNIAGVNGFAQINVWPDDDRHINVAAVAYPQCNTRIRLKITALYAK